MSSDIHVQRASEADITELVTLAARTFPLACPSSTPWRDIQDHIKSRLNAESFREHMDSIDTEFHLARDSSGRNLGYSMLVQSAEGAPAFGSGAPVELRRLYVIEEAHGKDVGAALLSCVERRASELGRSWIWLGTNQANSRAIKFYEKHAFRQVGTRTFQVGGSVERDFFMAKSLELS